MNADVTGWERLLVRWYYVMGPLARRGLTYILIIMGEFLLLSMLDDLVFHNTGLYLVGLFTMLAIVAAFTVAISYVILAANCNLNKRTWSSVAAKAQAARRENPSREKAPTPFTAREDGSGFLQASWRIAEPLGISLPDHRRFPRRVLAAALVLLAAVYVPHFVGRAQTMRQEMEAAAQTTRALVASFADAELDPFCIDPTKGHDKVSYYVTGDVVDEAGEETGSSIRVDVNNDGQVIETGYHLAVDPSLSQVESLAQAERDLELLHGALAAADVPALVPGLVTAHELFPEFREAFLAGSPYESISLDHYDVGEAALVDGAEVACYFFTDPLDEWDEHSEAYLWIRVEPAD